MYDIGTMLLLVHPHTSRIVVAHFNFFTQVRMARHVRELARSTQLPGKAPRLPSPLPIGSLLGSQESENQISKYPMSESKVIGLHGYLWHTAWPAPFPRHRLDTENKLFAVLVYWLVDWLIYCRRWTSPLRVQARSRGRRAPGRN